MTLPVVLKSGKNYITLVMDPDISFSELLNHIIIKFQEAERFFGDQYIALMFAGRSLSEREERQVLEAIATYTTVRISFLVEDDKFRQYAAERIAYDKMYPEDSLDEYGLPVPVETELNALILKGNVKAGETIHAIGSLVIHGSVAKGATLKAGGSVVVLGILRGQVYCGTDCREKEPFIYALDFRPENYRIGTLVGTDFPTRKKPLFGKARPVTAIVRLIKDELVIDDLNV